MGKYLVKKAFYGKGKHHEKEEEINWPKKAAAKYVAIGALEEVKDGEEVSAQEPEAPAKKGKK